MKNRSLHGPLGGLLGLAMLAASCAAPATQGPPASAGPPQSTASTASSRTVNDGVFTLAQANRGQQAFQANCASCHTIADFTGAAYQQAWNGRPLGAFHEVVATMMPQTAPGSLTPQQYADIVSHILRANGYAAGASELPTTTAAMNSIRIVPARTN